MGERDFQGGNRPGAAIAQGSPGAVIAAGAVALAYGATTLIGALFPFVTLATQSPEFDTLELRALRAPALHGALWVTIVETAFLTACGIGLTRLREWARTLFFALALLHVLVVTYNFWARGLEGPAHFVVLSMMRDFALYGGGAWFLMRAHVARLFHRPAD